MKTATYDLEDTSFTVDFTAGYDIGGTGIEVTDIADMIYTGMPIKPQLEIKHNGTDLVEDTDFKVTYEENTDVGTATITITGIGNYSGQKIITFNIVKASNPLAVTPKTAKVKYKNLRKKKQIVKCSNVLTVSNAQGSIKYSLISVKRGKSKKYKKYFKISATTGNVTVKKKLKKGTYKITCKVTAAGNTNYIDAAKTVTFRIKVK